MSLIPSRTIHSRNPQGSLKASASVMFQFDACCLDEQSENAVTAEGKFIQYSLAYISAYKLSVVCPTLFGWREGKVHAKPKIASTIIACQGFQF